MIRLWRAWRAKRLGKSELECYLLTCENTKRRYNPRTHVSKQIRVNDRVNRVRRGK